MKRDFDTVMCAIEQTNINMTNDIRQGEIYFYSKNQFKIIVCFYFQIFRFPIYARWDEESNSGLVDIKKKVFFWKFVNSHK